MPTCSEGAIVREGILKIGSEYDLRTSLNSIMDEDGMTFGDVVLNGKPAIRFDHIPNRGVRCVRLMRQWRGVGMDSTDAERAIHEEHIEGKRRVGHPERSGLVVRKDKEHSLIDRHFAHIHQAGGDLVAALCQSDTQGRDGISSRVKEGDRSGGGDRPTSDRVLRLRRITARNQRQKGNGEKEVIWFQRRKVLT